MMRATLKESSTRRNAFVSQQLAVIMPVLIVIAAVCIELGRYAYSLRNINQTERRPVVADMQLFEPVILVCVIVAFVWFAMISRQPRS